MDSVLNTEIISEAIVKVLRYYSLFQYPLKKEEILGNMSVKSSIATVRATLGALVDASSVFCYDEYYGLNEEIEQQVIRRQKANRLAEIKKEEAGKTGRFIYSFPFVRFVGISGSLSKGYADDEVDFDFFIVTAKNRLWVCRTLLHLFKKFTFLTGKEHKYCMNYFVDMQKLEIEEKNIFTAVEISSLIPVSGHDTCMELRMANQWADEFFPNGYVSFTNNACPMPHRGNGLKGAFEGIFNVLFAGSLNKMFMKLTDMKWRKKWSRKNYPMEDYDVAFKTTLHISKNHPANYQQRILTAISKFENGIIPNEHGVI